MFMRSLSLHTSIFCSLTLTAVGCGGGSTLQPGGGTPTMMKVGPSGGAVSSSDGKLAVAIPAGALPADVTITTEPAAAPAAGAVSTVYEIGPTGTQFAMPVTLTLHYDATALAGASESSLRVATFAGGSWQLLPGAVVDTQARTVSGVTTHLSPYAIVTEAAGKTCATVQTAFGCADAGKPSGGSGTSSGGTAPPNTGAGASGGTSTCEAPTCAAATNVCAQYPGAAMDSCTDGPTGYSASCCFAPNAPICFALTGAGAPCASTGGAGSCPPPPNCASDTAAMACAGYPGATLQNCTDTANGFTGACCFAPQAPVCVKTASARGCAGSTSGGTSCTPAPRCADGNPCARFVGAKASSCLDAADGFEATCCFPEGTLPIAGGSGSTMSGGVDGGVPPPDGGGTGATTGTGGAGGMTGAGGTCAPGATCTAGYRCGNASPSGACMDCMCGADGKLTCIPCDKPDGGGAGATTGTGGVGGMTGGGTCAPGEACSAGYRCGMPGPAGQCMECMCGADGKLACGPCGGDKPDGGGAGATTGTGGVGGMTGGGTCAPGEVCSAGYRCGMPAPAGQCIDCMCGADGTLACGPCGGDKPDGGGAGATTGAGGAGGTGGGGTATGPCQVNAMPSTDVGLPCGVMEFCPDGTDYRVRCDGTTGACTCFLKGVPTAATPTLACSSFNASAALAACGFPDGKI